MERKKKNNKKMNDEEREWNIGHSGTHGRRDAADLSLPRDRLHLCLNPLKQGTPLAKYERRLCHRLGNRGCLWIGASYCPNINM